MPLTYLGKKIGLNSAGRVECNELDLIADTVPEIKTLIRAAIQKSKKAAPVKVIRLGYHNEPIFGTTGAMQRGTGADDFDRIWFTNASGKREAVYIKDLYLDTPKNRELLKAAYELDQKSAELMRKFEEQLESAEKFKPSAGLNKTN